jgi:iron complex outermembrane receptor protein
VIWQPSGHNYEIQAFVENIEDNQYAYRRFISSSFGGVIGQFSPPRTAGVRISTHFGG